MFCDVDQSGDRVLWLNRPSWRPTNSRGVTRDSLLATSPGSTSWLESGWTGSPPHRSSFAKSSSFPFMPQSDKHSSVSEDSIKAYISNRGVRQTCSCVRRHEKRRKSVPSAAVSLTESERKQLCLIYSHATTSGRYFSQIISAQHWGEAWPWSNCECTVRPSAVLRALISDLTTMHLLSKVDCSNIEAFLGIWSALKDFQINIYLWFFLFCFVFFFMSDMSFVECGGRRLWNRNGPSMPSVYLPTNGAGKVVVFPLKKGALL